jgi:hypothetical protein
VIAVRDSLRRQAFAVGGHEPGFEGIVARRAQQCGDVPVLLGDEPFDLIFAVADQAQGDRLHAARRAGARQLAPKHRREGEADEVIECAAGEIGVDQRNIDVTRIGHRVEDGLLCDGVEHDPLHRLVADRLLLPQKIEHMPRDRLAFAIRVGCEE